MTAAAGLAPAGQKKIRAKDIHTTLTLTAGDLADALARCAHQHGVTIRVPALSLSRFEIGHLVRIRDGRIHLVVGRCLDTPAHSHGVYPLLDEAEPVEVGLTHRSAPGLIDALTTPASTTV